MAILKPFKGIRPKKELAASIACRPYDVLNEQEARLETKGDPNSFYHVIKPEIDFPDEHDHYAPEIYENGKNNMMRMIEEEIFSQDAKECYYIYAQKMSGRTQYGNPPTPSYPTRHRQNLERVWPTLPGRKIFKSYDDYSGTLKRGKKIEVYKYPYEYVDALMDAKVIISPWGWSPWCIRDLEAMACGCIVIKPECSNMLIYPDIYDPHRQLLVWCDILYEKLGSQLFYIYKSLDEMQDRADRGRHFVTDALYPNDKIYASWTKDLRRILENALERPAYSVASQMVDFNS